MRGAGGKSSERLGAAGHSTELGNELGHGICQMGYGRKSEEVEKGARGEWDEEEERRLRVPSSSGIFLN